MNTKIVVILVAAAFVSGMMVQIIPAEAAPECKKNENSSCWIRVSQLFETSLNKLQAVNKHFEGPPTGITAPPDDIKRKIIALLAEMDEEITVIQNKQTDWNFVLR